MEQPQSSTSDAGDANGANDAGSNAGAVPSDPPKDAGNALDASVGLDAGVLPMDSYAEQAVDPKSGPCAVGSDPRGPFPAPNFPYRMPQGAGPIKGALFAGGFLNNEVNIYGPVADRQRLIIVSQAGGRIRRADILRSLGSIAQATNRPEIANIGVILIGLSIDGLGVGHAGCQMPERVITLVPIHAPFYAQENVGWNRTHQMPHKQVVPFPAGSLLSAPILFVKGERDSTMMATGAHDWGRRHNAPWAIVAEPGAGHTDTQKAEREIISQWIDKIVPLRVGSDPTRLMAIDTSSTGALADPSTQQFAAVSAYQGEKGKASWLPDLDFAAKWKQFGLPFPYSAPPQPLPTPSGLISNFTEVDRSGDSDWSSDGPFSAITITPFSATALITPRSSRSRHRLWAPTGFGPISTPAHRRPERLRHSR
jgi:hypothetical protein